MTTEFDAPITEADDVTAQRDEVVSAVTAHAGDIARQLALLQGGDYGSKSLSTDAGEWTLKYEAGAIDYLRFTEKSGGGETYVVSTKQPPDPEALEKAIRDYDAFVASYNDYIDSLDGILDDVSTDFPAVTSAQSLVAERDRIVGRINDVATQMAGELHRYNGTDYGEFTVRVSSTRWELKREGDQPSYLRVGGEGGVYLLSQYGPPSAADVRKYAEEFSEFVAAFNDHVDELDVSLSHVSL